MHQSMADRAKPFGVLDARVSVSEVLFILCQGGEAENPRVLQWVPGVVMLFVFHCFVFSVLFFVVVYGAS